MSIAFDLLEVKVHILMSCVLSRQHKTWHIVGAQSLQWRPCNLPFADKRMTPHEQRQQVKISAFPCLLVPFCTSPGVQSLPCLRLSRRRAQAGQGGRPGRSTQKTLSTHLLSWMPSIVLRLVSWASFPREFLYYQGLTEPRAHNYRSGTSNVGK